MIDPELFLIQERDGLRLITPKKSTALADHTWTPETIHYRSRIETLDGKTVSQGFKKFMNLGQGPDGLRVTAADVIGACLRDSAVATVKLDGSLIVRSVYQGRVLLRTRGAFGYEYQRESRQRLQSTGPKGYEQSCENDSRPGGSDAHPREDKRSRYVAQALCDH